MAGRSRGVERLVRLAEAAHASGDLSRARSLARQALALVPDHPQMHAIIDPTASQTRLAGLGRGSPRRLLVVGALVALIVVAAGIVLLVA